MTVTASPRQLQVLWWGQGDRDGLRQRTLRHALGRLGLLSLEFRPRWRSLGDWEALWRAARDGTAARALGAADLVWVGELRLGELGAAARWARRRHARLVLDSLYSLSPQASAERAQATLSPRRARRAARADLLIAENPGEAEHLARGLGVDPGRIRAVPLGADEELFDEQPPPAGEGFEVLFPAHLIAPYGPQVIVEAARRYAGPPVTWTLLGGGPLMVECRRLAAGLPHIHFEPWPPRPLLAGRIGLARAVLGLFAPGEAAGRLIPEHVYQALACGRAVITRRAPAYPVALRGAEDAGLLWVAPGDPAALAGCVAALAAEPQRAAGLGAAARASFLAWYSREEIGRRLAAALTDLGVLPATRPAAPSGR